MKIKAADLEARNIGQLVQVHKPGEVMVGKLDRYKKFSVDGDVHTVTMRISGDTWQCGADDELEVWRSPELGAITHLRRLVEELADELLDDEDDDLDCLDADALEVSHG